MNVIIWTELSSSGGTEQSTDYPPRHAVLHLRLTLMTLQDKTRIASRLDSAP